MFLARVVGRVVASQRLTGLLGEKFLIVQPLDEQRALAGETLVACDAADSGPGDIVHVCDGRESTLALHDHFVPIDATIVGHVEEFTHDGPGPQVSAGELQPAPDARAPEASEASQESQASRASRTSREPRGERGPRRGPRHGNGLVP